MLRGSVFGYSTAEAEIVSTTELRSGQRVPRQISDTACDNSPRYRELQL
jgi:hypothetical protein